MFELHSDKHREKALSRFSHHSEIVLKDGFEPIAQTDLIKYSRFNGVCYVISWDEADGCFLSIQEAIARCINSSMAFVIFADTFALVKEETEKNAFFLIQK